MKKPDEDCAHEWITLWLNICNPKDWIKRCKKCLGHIHSGPTTTGVPSFP